MEEKHSRTARNSYIDSLWSKQPTIERSRPCFAPSIEMRKRFVHVVPEAHLPFFFFWWNSFEISIHQFYSRIPESGTIVCASNLSASNLSPKSYLDYVACSESPYARFYSEKRNNRFLDVMQSIVIRQARFSRSFVMLIVFQLSLLYFGIAQLSRVAFDAGLCTHYFVLKATLWAGILKVILLAFWPTHWRFVSVGRIGSILTTLIESSTSDSAWIDSLSDRPARANTEQGKWQETMRKMEENRTQRDTYRAISLLFLFHCLHCHLFSKWRRYVVWEREKERERERERGRGREEGEGEGEGERRERERERQSGVAYLLFGIASSSR